RHPPRGGERSGLREAEPRFAAMEYVDPCLLSGGNRLHRGLALSFGDRSRFGVVSVRSRRPVPRAVSLDNEAPHGFLPSPGAGEVDTASLEVRATNPSAKDDRKLHGCDVGMSAEHRWLRSALAGIVGTLMLVLPSCGRPVAAGIAPVPVVVDTDMSSDDVMGLLYLLDRPGLSIQAITVDGTGVAHGPAGARNVLRLMEAVGVSGIPVAYGPEVPLEGSRSFPPSWR